MTLVALPCAVVSYSTCELVTRGTVTPEAGTGWRGKGVMVYSTIKLCVFCLCVTPRVDRVCNSVSLEGMVWGGTGVVV